MKNLLILLLLGLSACRSNPDAARTALYKRDYSNIQILGYSWNCSIDKPFATEFYALNKNKVKVHGVVCSDWDIGWGDKSTIHLY